MKPAATHSLGATGDGGCATAQRHNSPGRASVQRRWL